LVAERRTGAGARVCGAAAAAAAQVPAISIAALWKVPSFIIPPVN
jgi:hypothetical protein